MNYKDEVFKLGLDLDNEKSRKFDLFYNDLIEINKVMNLTSITNKDEVYIKHFYDSISLCKAFNYDNNLTVCDVGSGAGFPSIPLAIMFPNLNIVIIDALQKRINFLNEEIKRLNLNNIIAIHARAEDYVKEKRDFFDIVTARAVARLNVLCELCLPLVKMNGKFLAMKGSSGIEELHEASNAITTLGGKINSTITFNLPFDYGERNIIVINKVKKCDKKYPRIFAKIKSNPL